MLRDDTEARDVAQETFSRLWAGRHKISDRRAVVGWLYRTSSRLVIDHYRSRRGEQPLSDGQLELGERGELDPQSRAHFRGALAQLAKLVPKKELEAAILSRIDGLTQEEIAEVMNISDRSVRRLLASFDARIQKLRATCE